MKDQNELTFEDLEKAFLSENVNMNIKDGDSNTSIITNPEGGITIRKSVDLEPYLQQAAEDRAKFSLSRNTQDHTTKIASIPKVIYYSIMDQCDMLGIKDKRDRNAFLIEELKKPEFESLLSLPKGMIRKSR